MDIPKLKSANYESSKYFPAIKGSLWPVNKSQTAYLLLKYKNLEYHSNLAGEIEILIVTKSHYKLPSPSCG